MAEEMKTFDAFWPYYVRAHSKPWTRRLHFVGTSAAMALAATGVLTGNLGLVVAAPVVGYGCAWIGHFFVEGNKPATFGHPLWSLRADFVMWSKIVAGTMDGEVEKYTAASGPASSPTPTNGHAASPTA